MASWTLTNLLAEIARYTVTTSAVEHDSATEQYGLIGRKLNEFVRLTDCLYFAGLTKTSVSTPTIDLESVTWTLGATSVKAYAAMTVRITDTGAEKVLEHVDTSTMNAHYSGYQFDATDTPVRWLMDSRTVLRLHPAPASAVNLSIDAFYYPPAITSASAGSDTITLPDECENVFIQFLVAAFLETVATGDAQARRNQMLAEARSEMRALQERYRKTPPWDGNLPPNIGVYQFR